jgi:acyl-coenzyme A synthetase/AMP-(fatty) acid ligase
MTGLDTRPQGDIDTALLAPTILFNDGAVERERFVAMILFSARMCSEARPGDVLLAGENRAGMVAMWLGAMLAGRRVTLVDPGLPDLAIDRLHRPGSAGLLCGDPGWLTRQAPSTTDRMSLAEIEAVVATTSPPDAVLRFTGSTILATSGTTGSSKLVEWPWSALFHAAQNMAMVGRYRPSDVVVTSLPLFHANALLVVLLSGMIAGATVAIDTKFSARRFSRTMRRYGGTKTSLLGSMAQLVIETDEAPHADVDRMIVAPCTGRVATVLKARYGTSVAQIYGQTDVGIMLWNDDVSEAHGDCGFPLPGWDASIDGDPGRGGELLVRSSRPGICTLGYVADDALTCSSRRDFWFHTGDLFTVVEGRFSFVGRSKDVVRTHGENVSCGEVEAVLRSVDGIRDAAVVGRPNRLGEEDVIAVVVSDIVDSAVLTGRVRRACTRQLPRHARPIAMARVAELPRTATEKVAKPLIDLDQLDMLPLGPATGSPGA